MEILSVGRGAWIDAYGIPKKCLCCALDPSVLIDVPSIDLDHMCFLSSCYFFV